MKIHVSIDDVIYSFKEAYFNLPKSIFEVDFFKCLKDFNSRFGAKFTLYVFENDGNDFKITDLPLFYFKEIEDSGFIKLGYHGYRSVGGELDIKLFEKEITTITNYIPVNLQAKTLRLHRYIANEDMVNILKKYNTKVLLCRDDNSRIKLNQGASYDLSELEMDSLHKGSLRKNEVCYRKTNIQLESHDKYNLLKEIERLQNEETLVIFTHERCIPEQEKLLEYAFEILEKHINRFIF